MDLNSFSDTLNDVNVARCGAAGSGYQKISVQAKLAVWGPVLGTATPASKESARSYRARSVTRGIPAPEAQSR
jgi:hypothetical protein